jgi:hypothetical protein
MPLLDHFHPPLKPHRSWHAFHNGWASNLAVALNQYLPEGYFAESNVVFGIEIDVATLEAPSAQTGQAITPSGASAAWQLAWTPPHPALTIPFSPVAETVEVHIYNDSGGLTLVGAIELVSPANKDRAEHRQAFASKCETYLREGVGLVIVDIVTERRANLHTELLARLQASVEATLTAELYATAYRLVEREQKPCLDIWLEPLRIGQVLPTLPLWLRDNWCLPVELGVTYERTCQGLKLAPIQ